MSTVQNAEYRYTELVVDHFKIQCVSVT